MVPGCPAHVGCTEEVACRAGQGRGGCGRAASGGGGQEEDQRRGSSTASGLVPQEALELEEGRPVGPGFWHGGQDDQEEEQEAPISKKA